MEITNRLSLQHRALEELKESTRTLKVAEQLLSVGNIKEAERLREEARQRRTCSVELMKRAETTTASTHFIGLI